MEAWLREGKSGKNAMHREIASSSRLISECIAYQCDIRAVNDR